MLDTKVLSNTIKTNFQILSTKYAKFQPNIQIFEYSISCLVTYIKIILTPINSNRMCSEHINVALMFMILRKLAENYVYQRNLFDQMPSHTPKSVKIV